jgi:hypothetical protein
MTRAARRWKAAIGLLLATSCYQPINTERRDLGKAAPHFTAPPGTTFTVELVEPIDSNVSEAPLDAVMVGPLVAADGSTIAKSGAVVAGRATGVRGASGKGLRLEIASIETVHGTRALSATLAPRQRDASLAAVDIQGPGPGYDALIGPPPAAPAPMEIGPTAIGGGPREAPPSPPRAESPRYPPIRLRAGARLDLLLTQPLAASETHPIVKPRSDREVRAD